MYSKMLMTYCVFIIAYLANGISYQNGTTSLVLFLMLFSIYVLIRARSYEGQLDDPYICAVFKYSIIPEDVVNKIC